VQIDHALALDEDRECGAPSWLGGENCVKRVANVLERRCGETLDGHILRLRFRPIGHVLGTVWSGALALVMLGLARKRNAPLAQSAEQLTLNQWVPGSSPGGCTKDFSAC